MSLLNVFLVWLPDFSLNLCYYSSSFIHYRYNHKFHVPHSLYLYTYTLPLTLFSFFFFMTFLSAGISTSISMHVSFSFLFLIIISGLFAVTSLSGCTAAFHNTVTSHHSLVCVCVCVCAICLSFRCLEICILSNANVHKLYRVS